ncbi:MULTISPECIES: hypothetical protein [Paenibacillus]|uniref:Uncharacterized protein n=2 Tax=Paenibacillus TaxID=44249 RepID=A0ABX2ZB18_PAEPO|nr:MULTISPECIES: hypothetical protein [Paenibacillus]MDR6779347.1 hypothetical protein [Paenibacillus peoriae]ODA08140.1 hypothetical protein A7312_08920 [Paenibacillus polymyxa]
MATPFSSLQTAFFNKIEKDLDFFTYNNVTEEEAMEIALSRSREYLKESLAKLKISCSSDISFDYDDNENLLVDDLTPTEIDLVANIMREKYYEKDMSLLKAFQVRFSTKDLQVFSPANERKTFMDMYYGIIEENNKMISQYASRDRMTGKLKSIDFSKYVND